MGRQDSRNQRLDDDNYHKCPYCRTRILDSRNDQELTKRLENQYPIDLNERRKEEIECENKRQERISEERRRFREQLEERLREEREQRNDNINTQRDRWQS